MTPVRVKQLKRTLSQSSRSTSTRILISSGIAKEGWVSLSWMATCAWGGGSGKSGAPKRPNVVLHTLPASTPL